MTHDDPTPTPGEERLVRLVGSNLRLVRRGRGLRDRRRRGAASDRERRRPQANPPAWRTVASLSAAETILG